jgi:Tol biopolymer transport system component
MLTGATRWRSLVLMTGVVGLACYVLSGEAAHAQAQADNPSILAPVNHQVGWLDLDAPRAQLLTQFDAPDYVADVAARPGGMIAAIAVVRTPPAGSTTASEIVALDLSSHELSPLAPDQDPNESLSAPQWNADGSRVFFQREDVSVVGTSYGGGATVQYPSRVDAVAADGSARSIIVDNARQPAPSPDGSSLAIVRRLDAGPALIVHSLLDGSERTVITPGHFTDIVSPRFSPLGDRIAFMAPVTSLGRLDRPVFAELRLLAPSLAMHGVAWDVWTVPVDATSAPTRLASVSADDGTVAWSPDGSRLFVYGGTGSFLVDGATGDITSLRYIQGYGSASWVAN